MMPPQELRIQFAPVMPINGHFVLQASQIDGYYHVPSILGCVDYLFRTGFMPMHQAQSIIEHIKHKMPDPSKLVYCLEASP